MKDCTICSGCYMVKKNRLHHINCEHYICMDCYQAMCKKFEDIPSYMKYGNKKGAIRTPNLKHVCYCGADATKHIIQFGYMEGVWRR